MKLDFCAVCGTTEDLQQHHIEPVVFSGIKRTAKKKKYDVNKKLKDSTTYEIFAYLFDRGIISDDETLTVCSYHHNILHGIIKFQKANHSHMIKQGQQNAVAKGIKIGRPTKINPILEKRVLYLRSIGTPFRAIAKDVKLGVGTIYDILKKVKPA